MQKLLLYSLMLCTLALPMFAAGDRSARRGLKKTLVWMVAFNVFYLVGVIYILPRLPG